MNRLKDKVAIITGGAGGIGKAAARRFAEEGAKVIIWDINEEKGKKTVEEFEEEGLEVIFDHVDTVASAAILKATEQVMKTHGKIDILINNAGITRDATLKKMTEEQWQQVIDVNLTGVFKCTKMVVPNMLKSGSGRIINTSSVVGLYGNFGQTNYAASKAGVIGMTKVWAKEFGRQGICVNAVAPGFIATEMVESVPENIINALKEKIPLSRLGVPEDIANVYLFLASDEASYINGTVISVDGGITI